MLEKEQILFDRNARGESLQKRQIYETLENVLNTKWGNSETIK